MVIQTRWHFCLGFRVLLLVCLLAGLVSCKGRTETYRETRFLFDTEVFIEATGVNAKGAVTLALEKMVALDQALNIYDANSEIIRLNQSAGIGPHQVSADTFEIIQGAIDIARLTEGYFNPALGPLINLWQEAEKIGKVPTEQEIQTLLPLTKFQIIELDNANQTVFLPLNGMALDLGGIAKGYAVEQAVEIMQEAGIKSAMVQAGGNIYTIGYKADGSAWRVGIRNPKKTDAIIGFINIHDLAIDTSGDYERFITINSVNYGHILDPFTGIPPEGVISCSIITERPILADALATAIFVMGVDKGLDMLEELPVTEGIIIDLEGVIYFSQGVEEFFVAAHDDIKK